MRYSALDNYNLENPSDLSQIYKHGRMEDSAPPAD